NP
ncbi:hypothetical protein S40285_10760, partial [Stachybotrys chlorohalonatus IBT 40285]